jgi:hypothetical protein
VAARAAAVEVATTANVELITELAAEATMPKVAVAATTLKLAAAAGTVAAVRTLQPLKRCPPKIG